MTVCAARLAFCHSSLIAVHAYVHCPYVRFVARCTGPVCVAGGQQFSRSVMKGQVQKSSYGLRPRNKRKPLYSSATSSQGSVASDDENPTEPFSSDLYAPSSGSDSSDSVASAPRQRRTLKRPRADLQHRTFISHGDTKPHTSSAKAPHPQIHLPSSFDKVEVKELQGRLLNWYSSNYRHFPWRAPPSRDANGTVSRQSSSAESAPGAPYAVWISEVMSQQTRIDVVVNYYERWMRTFPTIRALSEGSLDRINELWAGLGYYRRARYLHEGAKQIMAEHDGNVPEEVASLRKIKGIGDYTAGAISSIAFKKCEPAVDGNVERVLSRLRPGISTELQDVASGARAKVFRRLAKEIIQDVESPGDFNQALMELGATLCKPRKPNCRGCPVNELCGAYDEAIALDRDASDYVTKYPVKDVKKRVKVRTETLVACVPCVSEGGQTKYLVFQRPEEGLLAGMWEAPNAILPNRDSKDVQVDLQISALLEMVGNTLVRSAAEVRQPLDLAEEIHDAKTVSHIFSHIHQTLIVKVAVLKKSFAKQLRKRGQLDNTVQFQWVTREDLAQKAIATQMVKVFRAAGTVLGEELFDSQRQTKR